MDRFHDWLRTFYIPFLVIGLILWPAAIYIVHLICHQYGLLWQ